MMKQATRRPPAKKRHTPHPSKKSIPETDSPASLVRHVGKSLLLTAAIALALALVSSLAAYFSPDPDSLTRPLGIVCAALTAFFGGLIAIRIHKRSALLCGMLNGSAMMLLMILASLFFRPYASAYTSWLSCLLHVGFLLLSIAGSFVGMKKR
ncbi:MAG: TIGR04086 family membrane protein [Clostridia bacterium]|nr:TIGR04086 family membrane protein [Clostridia bacterium]